MKRPIREEWNIPASGGVPYRHPQIQGLMAVREFLLTETEEERVVLLRWVRETDVPVDRFSFSLEQLDAAGTSLGTVTVAYGERDLPSADMGEPFVPPVGIPVDPRCADIRIRLVEVASAQYVYRPRGNRVDVSFEPPTPWRYDESGGKEDGLSDEVSLRVESKRRKRVPFCIPAVLLSLLLLVWLILAPFFEGLY